MKSREDPSVIAFVVLVLRRDDIKTECPIPVTDGTFTVHPQSTGDERRYGREQLTGEREEGTPKMKSVSGFRAEGQMTSHEAMRKLAAKSRRTYHIVP